MRTWTLLSARDSLTGQGDLQAQVAGRRAALIIVLGADRCRYAGPIPHALSFSAGGRWVLSGGRFRAQFIAGCLLLMEGRRARPWTAGSAPSGSVWHSLKGRGRDGGLGGGGASSGALVPGSG